MTSTKSTTPTSPPPKVSLVWRLESCPPEEEEDWTCRGNHHTVIEPRPCQATIFLRNVVPTTDTTKSNSDETSLPHHTKTPSSSDDRIPESVLQYQRQRRKVQHAQKAGRTVRPEDLVQVYCDDHVVAIQKPPGILTTPGLNSNASMLQLVHQHYATTTTTRSEETTTTTTTTQTTTQTPLPIHDTTTDWQKEATASMVVHRLDMDTSGIVLFGRHASVTKELQALFRERQVVKEYQALVMGWIPLPIVKGHMDLPVRYFYFSLLPSAH